MLQRCVRCNDQETSQAIPEDADSQDTLTRMVLIFIRRIFNAECSTLRLPGAQRWGAVRNNYLKLTISLGYCLLSVPSLVTKGIKNCAVYLRDEESLHTQDKTSEQSSVQQLYIHTRAAMYTIRMGRLCWEGFLRRRRCISRKYYYREQRRRDDTACG